MTDSTSESSPSPPPRCGRRSDEESSTAGSFRRLLHANSAANAMSKGDGRSSMTEPRKSGSRLSNRLASVFVSTRGSAVERTSHHRGSIAAGGARNSVEEGGGGTAPPHWAAQHGVFLLDLKKAVGALAASLDRAPSHQPRR